jgi:hypothetical protein
MVEQFSSNLLTMYGNHKDWTFYKYSYFVQENFEKCKKFYCLISIRYKQFLVVTFSGQKRPRTVFEF